MPAAQAPRVLREQPAVYIPTTSHRLGGHRVAKTLGPRAYPHVCDPPPLFPALTHTNTDPLRHTAHPSAAHLSCNTNRCPSYSKSGRSQGARFADQLHTTPDACGKPRKGRTPRAVFERHKLTTWGLAAETETTTENAQKPTAKQRGTGTQPKEIRCTAALQGDRHHYRAQPHSRRNAHCCDSLRCCRVRPVTDAHPLAQRQN